ncbi:MAG TPA: hypothetical protein ENK79_02020, partial [Campylobacterales bacterium]|nr:hypothetical protein [Campylobacterales bacterium]
MEKDQLFILDKWIKSYLNEKKTLNLAKNTIMNYKRVLDSFYQFYSLKDEENSINSIYDINREFILEYLNNLGNRSINTKNLHITVIKSFLSYISEHNKENIDLTAKLKGLSAKNVKSESESLSEYESELLEKYLLDKRYKKNFLNVRNRLLVKLLYYTGIRASELLSVKLEDITLLEEEGVYKIYIMGKGSKYRYVYIPVDLISDELTFIQEHFLEDEILHTKNSQRYIAVTQKG